MKKVTVNVTYQYEIEIDESNEIVKEYESENELLVDCSSYHFGKILPVMNGGGVKVKDCTLIEVT